MKTLSQRLWRSVLRGLRWCLESPEPGSLTGGECVQPTWCGLCAEADRERDNIYPSLIMATADRMWGFLQKPTGLRTLKNCARLTWCAVRIGRQYYVLSLPRPSPLRDDAGQAAPPPAQPAASGGGGGFEAPPGFVLRGGTHQGFEGWGEASTSFSTAPRLLCSSLFAGPPPPPPMDNGQSAVS